MIKLLIILLLITAPVDGVEAIVNFHHFWAEDMELLENGTVVFTVSELTAHMIDEPSGVIFKTFRW